MSLPLQTTASECGLACLAGIASHFGHEIELAELRGALLAIAARSDAGRSDADRVRAGLREPSSAAGAGRARSAQDALHPALGSESLRRAAQSDGEGNRYPRSGPGRAESVVARGERALHRRRAGADSGRGFSEEKSSACDRLAGVDRSRGRLEAQPSPDAVARRGARRSSL